MDKHPGAIVSDGHGKEGSDDGKQINRPMTSAEFIARQIKNEVTPIERMATAYFKVCLKKGSIKKVGPDRYIEVKGKLEDDKGDPMELCD